MIIGVNEHMAWAHESNPTVRGQILDAMKAMGVTSIRLDFAWATIQPTSSTWSWGVLDGYINEAYTRGLSVLLMLYLPPAWASADGVSGKDKRPTSPTQYGTLLGTVAARYGSKLAAVEMWNEPDIATFWNGTRAQFVDLLAGAYPVAKALSPSTTFIAAAPTYIGLASGWFAGVYADSRYRPGTSYDAQAIHPYLSPSNLAYNAPATNWSINGITNLKTLRATYGDTSPLWATEFGWSTHANVGGEANYQLGVTEAEHSTNTVGAFSLLNSLGVVAAYVYCDTDTTFQGAHEDNFGLLRSDFSAKPVVAALTAVYGGSGAGTPGTIKVGSATPTKFMVGSVAARKVYMGNSLVWTAPATAPAGKYNSFSGIASGTPLTALNSASGGDAFDLVETSSGTITVNTSADLTNKYTQGIVCHGSASNGYARARWNLTSSTDGYVRFYMRTPSANSNATIRFVRALPTVAGPTGAFELRLNTTNYVELSDSGGVTIRNTESALAYNTIYRVEAKIVADHTLCELRVFAGESTTGLNTRSFTTSATNIPAWNAITFGYTVGSTLATWDPNIAAVAWSAADWIGPAV